MFVQRHAKAFEQPVDHLGADELMAVEGPADFLVKTLGRGFANIVQKGRPSQPEIGCFA